ncbi:MAG: glycosyltransferase [Aeromonas sp.]
MIDITCVIVTYNRMAFLKKALKCFENQTYQPKRLVVVNNASTDGTYEFLDEWKNIPTSFIKDILNLSVNTGGSGGFHAGLLHATSQHENWIWLSDDDAFPDERALEIFSRNINSYKEFSNNNLGAVCGSVINNGFIDVKHRRRQTKSKGLVKKYQCIESSEYENGLFELNLFSYVGAIISKSALLDVGLTEKDYFIWFDDTEHSMRISKKYKIICDPSIKVVHDIDESNVFSWKKYYGIRNELMMYKKHHFLTYIYLFQKKFFRSFKKGRSTTERTMIFRALMASVLGKSKIGIDERYRPGKKIK